MNKEVTPPLLLAAIIFIVMAIAGACGWSDAVGVEWRGRFKVIFWLCLPLLGLCIAWHFWSTRRRPDLQPDILAALFPPDAILQLGACHVLIQIEQVSSGLDLIVLAQNQFDQEVNLCLQFPAQGGYESLDREVAPLETAVPASACIMARNRHPLKVPFRSEWVLIKPSGSCRQSFSANQVRFTRRDALQTETKGWVTLLGLLGGIVAGGGARTWRIEVPSAQAAVETAAFAGWEIKILWRPETSPGLQQVSEEYQAFSKT